VSTWVSIYRMQQCQPGWLSKILGLRLNLARVASNVGPGFCLAIMMKYWGQLLYNIHDICIINA